MKKWISIVLILLAAAELSGCASVQKKFTRKKKQPKHVAANIYLEEPGAYQKKFSNDYYYKTHYTMWKSWQSELLIQLGGNGKKVARCAQEALGHLVELNNYLVPEAQSDLKPSLDELTKIVKKIESGSYSTTEEGAFKYDLERIKRVVANNFYYDKVKDKILPDTVDLGGDSQDTPPPQNTAE